MSWTHIKTHNTLNRLDRIDEAAQNGVYTTPCTNKEEANKEMQAFIAKMKNRP